MNDPTRLFIQLCWATWLVYWVAMAFTTKRTVERGGWSTYRLVAGLLFLGLAGAAQLLDVSASSELWHTTTTLGLVTDCIVLAGLALTVWARVALGRNWSAEITFKENHELIESGPYALVRHPIYTGLIAMALGTAINYGRPFGFVVLAAICGALWWKAREEERVMTNYFPEAYAQYKARVHAIIPFVL
jgi:protein-S-isoprenylcysteine O-methyltransferase Ste14